MSSRRKFIQKLTAPVLALPLLNLTQTKFLSDSEEKPYDGPILSYSRTRQLWYTGSRCDASLFPGQTRRSH